MGSGLESKVWGGFPSCFFQQTKVTELYSVGIRKLVRFYYAVKYICYVQEEKFSCTSLGLWVQIIKLTKDKWENHKNLIKLFMYVGAFPREGSPEEVTSTERVYSF